MPTSDSSETDVTDTSESNAAAPSRASKSRSGSARHGDAADESDSMESTNTPAEVMEAFVCPVCTDYMIPPYVQCTSGHLVCSTCRPKLPSCPTCRGPAASIRNLGLEKIANTVRFPCKFNGFGCKLKFHHLTKPNHEEGCDFRPYCCPCPTNPACEWQGVLQGVVPHMLKKHLSIATLQGDDVLFKASDMSAALEIDWIMVQTCFEHNFLFFLQKKKPPSSAGPGPSSYHCGVMLIGSKNDAKSFSYRLELIKEPRQVVWKGPVRSIHEGISNTVTASDCLTMNEKIVKFMVENEQLEINVTINKTKEAPH